MADVANNPEFYVAELERALLPVVCENLLTPQVNGILVIFQTYVNAHLQKTASYENDPQMLWVLAFCSRIHQLLKDSVEGSENHGVERTELILKLLAEEQKRDAIPLDSVTCYNDSYRCASKAARVALEDITKLLQCAINDRVLGDELAAAVSWGKAFLDSLFQVVVKTTDPSAPTCTLLSFHNAIHTTAFAKWISSNVIAQIFMSVACEEPLTKLFGVGHRLSWPH